MENLHPKPFSAHPSQPKCQNPTNPISSPYLTSPKHTDPFQLPKCLMPSFFDAGLNPISLYLTIYLTSTGFVVQVIIRASYSTECSKEMGSLGTPLYLDSMTWNNTKMGFSVSLIWFGLELVECNRALHPLSLLAQRWTVTDVSCKFIVSV